MQHSAATDHCTVVNLSPKFVTKTSTNVFRSTRVNKMSYTIKLKQPLLISTKRLMRNNSSSEDDAVIE